MMGQGVFHLIAQGGITMVILAIFSIFSLAVIGERIYTYYKAQRVTQQVAEKAMQYGADGRVSPLVGLFGTVRGIIRAFEAIARTGSGGLGTVSAGIAEALVATAA